MRIEPLKILRISIIGIGKLDHICYAECPKWRCFLITLHTRKKCYFFVADNKIGNIRAIS